METQEKYQEMYYKRLETINFGNINIYSENVAMRRPKLTNKVTFNAIYYIEKNLKNERNALTAPKQYLTFNQQ